MSGDARRDATTRVAMRVRQQRYDKDTSPNVDAQGGTIQHRYSRQNNGKHAARSNGVRSPVAASLRSSRVLLLSGNGDVTAVSAGAKMCVLNDHSGVPVRE